MALLSRSGWRVVLATVFTESVPNPAGFALACQLDKGLPADADYMALRRAEDREAADVLGAEAQHLDFPEAPHRGYGSAPELFAGIRAGDGVWREVAKRLEGLIEQHSPEAVFAPQALGNHADHLQVVRALTELGVSGEIVWWRDAPYATRDPRARPSPLLPADVGEAAVDVGEALAPKLDACAAYTTQISFQFGGEEPMRRALSDFAAAEARRLGVRWGVAETFLCLGDGRALQGPLARVGTKL
jgi:LmbE family N-acetylglucosaminyl deacetylase